MLPADKRFALWEWLAFTSRRPEPPSTGTMVAVLVCSIYQSLLVAMLLFTDNSQGAGITGTLAGSLTVGIGGIGAAVLLIGAPRFPLGVLIIECVVLIAAAYATLQDTVLFPLLFAVFAATSRLPTGRLALAGLVVLGSTALSATLVSSRAGFVMEFLGMLSVGLCAAVIGVTVRSVRGWRRLQHRALVDTQIAENLARQRNLAEERSRIAGELHDSVGHKLTSIIALSEGLLGATVDVETEEAIQGINTVARESLAETRGAVRALSVGAGSPRTSWSGELRAVADGDDSYALALDGDARTYWERGLALVEQIRSLGLAVDFSETGERSTALAEARLCFTITREALTNAVRHGGVPGHATTTWDHRDGRLLVSVENPASRRPGSNGGGVAPGTGLFMVRARTEAHGGTLTYGWDASSRWCVFATIPVARVATQPHPSRFLPRRRSSADW